MCVDKIYEWMEEIFKVKNSDLSVYIFFYIIEIIYLSAKLHNNIQSYQYIICNDLH